MDRFRTARTTVILAEADIAQAQNMEVVSQLEKEFGAEYG